MSLAGTMDKASSLSCLCLSSDQTARPPVQIVLPYPPDPIMGGPIVPIPERSADPARDVNINR
jgi:hypothetical protein